MTISRHKHTSMTGGHVD